MDAAIPIALPADAILAGRAADRAPAIGHARARAACHGACAASSCSPSHGGKMPALPVGDALDDATVLIAGRGPLYPGAQRRHGRARQDDRRAQRGDRRQASQLARHRRHRGRRRLFAAHGRGLPHRAGAGHPLPRHSGRGDRRGAGRISPRACPISTTSTAIRPGWSRAWCRWCACMPSRRGSSAC